MENWQREIILSNTVDLIKLTSCNPEFLGKLLSCKILSGNDLEELNAIENAPMKQADKFYKIIVQRVLGFEKLLEALRVTSQSGALHLLTGAAEKPGARHGVSDVVYDEKLILGKGSNGTIVFKGKLDSRDVAVKRIHPNIVDEKTIVEEVEVLRICDAHENIVRYFNIKYESQFVLIVLELCDMTLKDWVASKSVEISSVEVLKQTTVGLAWLHEQRIVHRDLKPENILLSSKPARVKISDFGLSRRIVDGRSCVSTVAAGTQGWLAPEVLEQIVTGCDTEKCKFTYSSDVFALGCVYYYVLTDGKHAFGDLVRRNANILDGKNPDLRALSCPVFWSRDRYSSFLQDIRNSSELKTQASKFIWTGVCPADHASQIVTKKKIGCVVPLAYIQLQNITELQQYYDSSCYFSNEELKYLPEVLLKDVAQTSKPDASRRNHGSKHDVTRMRKEFKPMVRSNSAKDVRFINRSSTRKGMRFYSVSLDRGSEQTSRVLKIIEELERMDSKRYVARLFEIVKAEDLNTIEVVLENQVNNQMKSVPKITDIWDYKLKSLLHVAVEFREHDVVEYLVKFQEFSKVLCKPRFRNSLIHACIKQIHMIKPEACEDKFTTMETLFNIKPELVNSRDDNQRTPLHVATDRVFENGQQIRFIRMLLSHSADANAKEYNGCTPLHCTVYHKSLPPKLIEIVRLLIENKADPDAADNDGNSFLHLATYYVPPNLYHELVEYLVSINRTKSFNLVSSKGSTVLHLGVYNLEPSSSTLEIFKTHHVDFNAIKESGETVIFSAIKGGRTDVFLRLLIEFGADYTVINNNASTALHYAASWTNLSALRLFISLGCDVNAQNKFGNTPLHEVFLENDGEKAHEIVSELVKHGADVNVKNACGEVPLDVAKKLVTYWKLDDRTVELLQSASRAMAQRSDDGQRFLLNLQQQGRLYNIFSGYWRL